mmetsp:Transcript_112535/g.363391  ORF Transcript_112535/g.363391 Transcript_112535/m.363391 type:complete len:336 (+) Transcript_112535:220-1227(+)
MLPKRLWPRCALVCRLAESDVPGGGDPWRRPVVAASAGPLPPRGAPRAQGEARAGAALASRRRDLHLARDLVQGCASLRGCESCHARFCSHRPPGHQRRVPGGGLRLAPEARPLPKRRAVRGDVPRAADCFLAACRALGPGCVDFDRLCVTGFSMGAQAAWNIGLRFGDHIAALAPMAGCCSWPGNCWEEEGTLARISQVSIRAYSMEADNRSYAWRDFAWLARHRGLPRESMQSTVPIPEDTRLRKFKEGPNEFTNYCWGIPVGSGAGAGTSCELASRGEALVQPSAPDLQLALLRGGEEDHNCWDLVYAQEETFGLLRWMATCRRTPGAGGVR